MSSIRQTYNTRSGSNLQVLAIDILIIFVYVSSTRPELRTLLCGVYACGPGYCSVVPGSAVSCINLSHASK